MMATQRAGKGSSGVEENGSVVSESSSQESATKVRQAKKAKVLKEQQQRSRTRWALVSVLLALAVIGFCYYYWYYQETDLSQQRTQQSMPKPRKEKPKGEKQKPKTAQKTKKAQSKEQKEQKGNMKQKRVKGGKPKTSKGKGRRSEEAEFNRVEQMKSRVLRQPMTGSDPDRPHVLDIIAADNLLMEGDYREALDRFNAIISQFPQSPRALLGKGLTLVRMSKEKKSNKLMDTAIEFFRKAGLESFLGSPAIKLSALLAMVDHARDRGNLKLAIEGTEKLVELYEDNVVYANQLGILYLSKGSMKKARAQFKKNVEKFDDDSYSKAQLGYILYSEKQYEQALPLILEGIRQDDEIRVNGNFYNYAGDILVRLNRSEEAFALYGEAVGLGLFPSVWQRSMLTEPGLTASPWWSPQDTGYMTDFTRIEKAMENITSEALALFDAEKMAFMDGTKKGAPHYLLFSKGKKKLQNCLKAQRTCALLETFPEAAGCRRGTVKFSIMPPHAHVSPHVGGTNVKLQVLVALDMDMEGGVRVRVAEETKVLRNGQICVIDESFEKEVWYVGRTPALYLTIDVWHPDLSTERQRQLGVL